MSAVDALLDKASAPIGGETLPDSVPLLARYGPRGLELESLLRARNGFFAFASALHVLPWGAGTGVHDLASWNSPDTWRSAYEDLMRDGLFFAQDIVGIQFCIHDEAVWSFEPETARFTSLAPTIEDWAALILLEHRQLTGWPIAQAWQELHGALPPQKRLSPKLPFVFGGAFDASNLIALDAAEHLRFGAMFATAIRDVPDGTSVIIEVED